MDESLQVRGNFVNTPLRRKSTLKLPVIQALIVNDDDAERLARRQSINTTSSPPTSNSMPVDRRRSLGLSALANVSVQEMNMKMAECIKLNTQNKINTKNAFSLEMIDFMAYMITKQDKTMTSLQMATTSLDVSTKIYGFRVDGVHAEVLRILCSMEEQNKKGPGKSVTENGPELEPNENNPEGQVKKKKKRSKQRILTNQDSLRTVVQTAKPSLLAMCETDVRTTDSLSQAILPLHSTSSFYLQPYHDVILDSVSEKQFLNSNGNCPMPRIEDVTDKDICPALSNFRFLDETVDSPDDTIEDDVNRSDNIYQFDLEGSLPDNDPVQSNMNYFDMDHTDDVVEEVQLCAKAGGEVEKIVDFSNILSNRGLVNTISEYSVVPKSLSIHWAGPSHWKVRTVGKSVTNSSIETRAAQRPGRKRKSLDLLYEPDTTEDVKSKFVRSQSVNLQPITTRAGWTDEKVTLPLDVHYDIKQACKYYLHPTVINCFDEDLNTSSAEAADNDEHHDYGDQDMSVDGPDIHADNFISNTQASVGPNDLIPNSQLPFTKDNLVAQPKLAKKIVIGYSTRAKKVDMRELKNTIWNGLTQGLQTSLNLEGSVQPTSESIIQGIEFHKVYKQLPGKLVKTKPDALSFPISFVSLLHLANEKSLKINVLPDMSDVIVKSE